MKLPVLISIPHGGTKVPIELSKKTHLCRGDIFNNSDLFAREIFGIKESVEATVAADISRLFIDLYRNVQETDFENPNGIISQMAFVCFASGR